MTKLTVQDLIQAGVHFGCRVSRWNPKMAPYIHGRRNLIHVIDLRETMKAIGNRNLVVQRAAELPDPDRRLDPRIALDWHTRLGHGEVDQLDRLVAGRARDPAAARSAREPSGRRRDRRAERPGGL